MKRLVAAALVGMVGGAIVWWLAGILEPAVNAWLFTRPGAGVPHDDEPGGGWQW